jgi:hypothetical protein
MAKAKTPTKRSAKSPVKSPGRRRNAASDQALSSDSVAKNAMPKRTKRAQQEPAQQPAQELPAAGIDRVIAEWGKVDAALDKVAAAVTALTRGEPDQALPPLTIRELASGDGMTGGWAVVSSDPQMPLTEQQAKEIVATMQSLHAPTPIGIAAE